MIWGYLLYSLLSKIVFVGLAMVCLLVFALQMVLYWQSKRRTVLLHTMISFAMSLAFTFESAATFTASITNEVAFHYLAVLSWMVVFLLAVMMIIVRWVLLYHTTQSSHQHDEWNWQRQL